MAARKVRVLALDALLRPRAHVEVVALLVTGPIGAAHRLDSGGEILRAATVARTDADGQAVLDLEPNDDTNLYPEGTYYEVRVKGTTTCWTIAVPDTDGPVELADDELAWDVGDPDIAVMPSTGPGWDPMPATTATDVAITAGTPAFLDASTVSAQFDTVMSGASLSGDDVTAEKAVVTGFLVTDADDDVESRLGNLARLAQYDVVTRLQDRRRLDTAEDAIDAIEADETIVAARLAVARWAEANPQTGPYLEVCGGNTHNGRAFIYDSTLTFTTGSDVRATVMLPDITTLNRWMEILTRTADGLGSWDAYELALWMTEDHDLQVFHEHTRTGGTVEVSPFAAGPGPALGVPVRVRQTTVFATGVTNVYVATVDEGDVATSDGQRWLLVDTATDPAGSTSFIANAEPWMIGAGGADVGGHMRVYDLEVRSSVDGSVIARPDIAGTANGAQVVVDDIAGEWDASHGDGVVVVPSSGSNPTVDDIDATGTPSASTYLRGDGTWATPAGGGSVLLAHATRATATTTTGTTTSDVLQEIDATNLSVTFTAPANGQVVAYAQGYGYMATGSGSPILRWGLVTSAGAEVARATVDLSPPTTMTRRQSFRRIITGLTPGTSYTWRLAHTSSDVSLRQPVFRTDANGSTATLEIWSAPTS